MARCVGSYVFIGEILIFARSGSTTDILGPVFLISATDTFRLQEKLKT